MRKPQERTPVSYFVLVGIFMAMIISVGGQSKSKDGFLFAHVSITQNEVLESAELAPRVSVTIKGKNRLFKLISDKSGVIYKPLEYGKYCLFSAVNINGVSLTFPSGREKCFVIRRNRQTRFDILLTHKSVRSQPSAQGEMNSIDEPESISFCDLLKTPDSFSGRTVRTSAIYRYGLEWSELFCVNCAVGTRVWAERHDSTRINKKIRNRIKWSERGKIVVVTAVGKLSNAGNFGQMGRYKYQFIIDYVESADVILNESPGTVPEAYKDKVMCACKAEKAN